MKHDETLGTVPNPEHRRERNHLYPPTDREIAIPLAGALCDFMCVSYGKSMCADIDDGVSVRMGDSRYGFVMPFAQLEQWYELAKQRREELRAAHG